jgi:uncharacterized membrane protein (DUF373 family)
MDHPDSPRRRGLLRLTELWLARADRTVYVWVALLFLLAAVAMTVYSVLTFVLHLGQNFPLQLVIFVNDLLLVLIIMEVLGTVRSYLATGSTSLRPFLYIGIISSTRRILIIGAETTLGDATSEATFRRLMIDLGVNGAVVLALAVALFLFGRHQAGGESASERAPDPEESPHWQ